MNSRSSFHVNAARHVAVQDGGNLLQFVHHAGELFGVDGLRPVGEGLFGLVMDLDPDTTLPWSRVCDGAEVLRRIRATSRLPVLLLTARGEDVDRIVGLELGANDYIVKPFFVRELVARIKIHFRGTTHRIGGNGFCGCSSKSDASSKVFESV